MELTISCGAWLYSMDTSDDIGRLKIYSNQLIYTKINDCIYQSKLCIDKAKEIYSKDKARINSYRTTKELKLHRMKKLTSYDKIIYYLSKTKADGMVYKISNVSGWILFILSNDFIKIGDVPIIEGSYLGIDPFELIMGVFNENVEYSIDVDDHVASLRQYDKARFNKISVNENKIYKKKDEYRILTYNVHSFYDFAMKYTFNDMMKFLKTAKANIICLQEAYCDESTSSVRLISYLNKLSYKYIVHDEESGILVASMTKFLYNYSDTENRFIHISTVMKDCGYEVNIVAMHLTVDNEDIRMKEIGNMFDYIDKLDAGNLILLGDLNTLSKQNYSKEKWDEMLLYEQEYSDFGCRVTNYIESQGFSDAISKCSDTNINTSIYDRKVDYIYYSYDMVDKVRKYVVLDNVKCSDHLPTFVDLINVGK